MTRYVVWQGTEEEIKDLTVAVQHNCTCASENSARKDLCAMHAALLDQRVLDHLLWGRRIAARFLFEEWMLGDLPD